MIRYDITQKELRSRIKRKYPRWLGNAEKYTTLCKEAGDYVDKGSPWSTIKPVFMELQYEKCAYCERKLASVRYGKKEHDVEHYRPKNAVEAWPTQKMKEEKRGDYNFSTGSSTDKGYYLLAFNVLNYADACSSCNSSLKASYFPVGRGRRLDTVSFAKLKEEEPYLLFPIGKLDDHRPEDLITFEGMLPIPRYKRGLRYKRARVTIDFFDLDTREDLTLQRAQIITTIWTAYNTLNRRHSTQEDIEDAEFVIRLAESDFSPHTNCARSFIEACRHTTNKARDYKNDAKRYLDAKLKRD
jgi:hypothetical protein